MTKYEWLKRNWVIILIFSGYLIFYFVYTVEVNRINTRVEEMGCNAFFNCPDGYYPQCIRDFKTINVSAPNYIINETLHIYPNSSRVGEG